EHTGELIRRTVDGDVALRIQDTRYGYDDAGNTKRISPTEGQDAAAAPDTQCFAIDALGRTTDADRAHNAPQPCANPAPAATVGGHDSPPQTPTPGRPAFQQNAELHAYVSVGFSFGSADAPHPGMYAYIWPQPDGLGSRDWGVPGATWNPDAGLVQLPWPALLQTPDPIHSIVTFGDAVHAAAVDLSGWPADWVCPRVDGWYMSRTPTEQVQRLERERHEKG
ncbi:DUF5996 family protein, partial [Streptomyces albidoflavus]|uniref:DUF5996 family protein n=1 Tax=Streptomyces albidoflavus TaxID=1886 RepID=UPI00211C3057